MYSVYSVQNFCIGSLVVWFFWLLCIHLPQDLVDRRHAAQFYHFCPSSDPLVPWRAKVGRQSWFTSRPHGSTLVSGTHLVGWGWSSSPTYLCPSKYAEGLNFLPPGSMHRRWMALLLPQPQPAALYLWKPHLSGLLWHALPFISLRLQWAGRWRGGRVLFNTPLGSRTSSDLGEKGVTKASSHLWPTEPLTMKMSSIVLLNLSHCCWR